MYPSCDPWGRCFDANYMPSRAKLAGNAITGPYHFILDGFQGDADWIAKTFQLTRSLPSSKAFMKSYRRLKFHEFCSDGRV